MPRAVVNETENGCEPEKYTGMRRVWEEYELHAPINFIPAHVSEYPVVASRHLKTLKHVEWEKNSAESTMAMRCCWFDENLIEKGSSNA